MRFVVAVIRAKSKIAPVTFKHLGVCVCARYNVHMKFAALVPFVLCSPGRRRETSSEPPAVAPRKLSGWSRRRGLLMK